MLNSAYCAFPPLIKVFLFKKAHLICRFDSCPCELFLAAIVVLHVTWTACWSEGHAIGWLKMTSVVAFFVWYLTGNFTVFWLSTNPHYRQGRVCKAGTGIAVDASSEERTSNLPGRWVTWSVSWLGRWTTWPASWRWRQRSRSLSWPVGWCFKSREAWTSAFCRCVGEILSSFRDKTCELAIHNPHYWQQSRVCKGGTDITFYWEVGWTGACRSTNALQAKMSGPVHSEDSWRMLLLLLMKNTNTRARLVWLMPHSREVGTSALWRMHLLYGEFLLFTAFKTS